MNMKKTLIGLLLVLFAMLASCAGYVPGRQAYWDAQVREMCEKDGGVHIVDRVRITKNETNFLGQRDGHVQIFEKVSIQKKELDEMLRAGDGFISLKMKELSGIEDAVYMESKEKNIRDANPRVRRTEWLVVRQTDKKVVATWNSYGRIGGDMPTGLVHDSSFRCPDWKQTWIELRELFLVKEN